MTNDGTRAYVWDGENRLIRVEWGTNVVENTYDYMSRRIARSISVSVTGHWSQLTGHTFLYDGWNLLAESVQSTNPQSTTYYTWGLDLSGSLQGAGGIGGLLSVHPLPEGEGGGEGPFFPSYDANGNVAVYTSTNGTLVARYDYDAYGNFLAQSGSLANEFVYKFSTKYTDDETRLVYYGHRYYSPEMGRWINRDPIAIGGCSRQNCPSRDSFIVENVFVNNSAISSLDMLGLACVKCPSSAYPLWGPKIKPSSGPCGHKYRSSIAEHPPGPPNGCGSTGTAWVPDSYLGLVSFTDCCNDHDDCYGTCGKSKTGCDLALGACMSAKCTVLIFVPPLYLGCTGMAGLYPAALTPAGWPAFESAQDGSCKWIDCCK